MKSKTTETLTYHKSGKQSQKRDKTANLYNKRKQKKENLKKMTNRKLTLTKQLRDN